MFAFEAQANCQECSLLSLTICKIVIFSHFYKNILIKKNQQSTPLFQAYNLDVVRIL